MQPRLKLAALAFAAACGGGMLYMDSLLQSPVLPGIETGLPRFCPEPDPRLREASFIGPEALMKEAPCIPLPDDPNEIKPRLLEPYYGPPPGSPVLSL